MIKKKKSVKQDVIDHPDECFENAQPSLTHMALLTLLNKGKLKYIVTQVLINDLRICFFN